MRFIHTSDWQIGMPFKSTLNAAARERMGHDRIATIRKIAALANEPSRGIDFVLVCGDLVDSPSISSMTIKKMMLEISKIVKPVYLLAGNHEWAGTTSILENEEFKRFSPSNLKILVQGVNEINETLEILAAPLDGKHSTRDTLSEALESVGPIGKKRIVAGHGTVLGFGANERVALGLDKVIAAHSNDLIHYVALGDRHTTTVVTEAGEMRGLEGNQISDGSYIFYSGAHEATDFNELDPGNILVVEIPDSGSPIVEKVHVGSWTFARFGTGSQDLHKLRSVEDLAALQREIESFASPEQTVVKIYLDSIMPSIADETHRQSLFHLWHSEFLAGFVRSERSLKESVGFTSPDEIRSTLNGYVADAYEDLLQKSKGQDVDSVEFAAVRLFQEALGNR
jgi:DNA repair exonuclease SbcCD nuclease subunit